MVIIPAALLSVLSIVVISSSSMSLALQQLAFAVLGLGIYFALRAFDYRSLSQLIKPAYFIVLGLLAVVFLLGTETRGSVRWIPLGPLHLQPSEFAKPFLVLALARFWSKHLATWKNILASLGILMPAAALVFEQPDLGTTITLIFIWAVMLFCSNISFKKIGILGLIGAVTIPAGWFLLKGYQRQRFLSFLSPMHDPQGLGYNVIQSMIAVGSGELTGRGLGRGTQSRLQFLPEFHTDFIYASIAEELGLVGSLIVLALYAGIFYFLFRSLNTARDRFGELIVIGVTCMLFIQIVINVGMNTGLLPITGITLPLLSYGGSSVITVFISLGLAASVEKFGTTVKR